MSGSISDDQRRLYRDLSWTWPLISPPEHYIGEAEELRRIIKEHARIEVETLLDLGCGGGHNDYTLKKYFEVTGVDVSQAMLSRAEHLNPDVAYTAGDMRTVRLGKRFDAVLIADSINYMLTVDDLRAAFATAFEHLKPGGVLCTYVEQTVEGFEQNRTECSTHTADGVEIAFIENLYDPDPTDTTYEMTFVYLIRRDGRLEIETDRHLGGIFRLETWSGLLQEVGFEVVQVEFEEACLPLFVGLKPSEPGW